VVNPGKQAKLEREKPSLVASACGVNLDHTFRIIAIRVQLIKGDTSAKGSQVWAFCRRFILLQRRKHASAGGRREFPHRGGKIPILPFSWDRNAILSCSAQERTGSHSYPTKTAEFCFSA
jgi:hypothetical protein